MNILFADQPLAIQSPSIFLAGPTPRSRHVISWRPEALDLLRCLGFAGTVLCIDDEQLQLQLRTMLFEAAGFKVLQARSASLALEIFRTQQVDAVVMDYWLSGTNGTTIAEEMKRLQPRIPIVMLSGYSSLPGEGAVVDAWLRKAQVEPEEIVNAVKRLIGFHTDVQRSS